MERTFAKKLLKAVQYILLVISISALAFFLYHLIVSGPAMWAHPQMQRYSGGIFLLLATGLLINILLEVFEALKEWGISNETPPAFLTGRMKQSRFRMTGSPRPLTQHCVEILQHHFPRFYGFHKFKSPHLFYYYLAQKGYYSLFARPWIKTGFLLFFLFYFLYLFQSELLPVWMQRAIIAFLALSFWIPGIIALFFSSYQKLWLCVGQEYGTLYLTLTYQLDSSSNKLQERFSALNQEFLKFLKAHYTDIHPQSLHLENRPGNEPIHRETAE